MTPHPSQWGHRRRKECHPEPPPPSEMLKRLPWVNRSLGRGSSTTKLVGLGTQAPVCGSGVRAWAKVTPQAGL